jgi:hypothetical protein
VEEVAEEQVHKEPQDHKVQVEEEQVLKDFKVRQVQVEEEEEEQVHKEQ